MTDIDKAVELARLVVNANAKLEGVAADIAMDLARAVLAMMPVVEAARAWAATEAVCEDDATEPTATALGKTVFDLDVEARHG